MQDPGSARFAVSRERASECMRVPPRRMFEVRQYAAITSRANGGVAESKHVGEAPASTAH